jgi:hypothetical protein
MVRFFVIIGLLLCSPSVFAQKVIEMFEGQNDLPESTSGIKFDSLDAGGSSESESGAYGGFTMIFEREGSSILVPATVQGKPVYFVFDTGATTSTLSYDFAKAANILPKSDYPTVQAQTANGMAVFQFGLIDQLVLGGRLHAGVTFSVCSACPTGMHKGKPIVGLLGLNVISRYRVSIDDGAGKIEMTPGSRFSDRSRDIGPWLVIEDFQITIDTGKHKALIKVQNLAPRRISDVTLMAQCADGKQVEVDQKSIEARGKTTFAKLSAPGDCRIVDFSFDQPKW